MRRQAPRSIPQHLLDGCYLVETLVITDREGSKIADVMFKEISLLVPGRKDREPVRTNMTINGKHDPEEYFTILFKIQIADENGHVRTIDFSFDIVTDSPIDIANEMVEKLVITDHEPGKIAEVMSQEFALLFPGWKDREPVDEGHYQFKGQCSMLLPDSPPQTFGCGKGKKKLSRWLEVLKRRLLKIAQCAR